MLVSPGASCLTPMEQVARAAALAAVFFSRGADAFCCAPTSPDPTFEGQAVFVRFPVPGCVGFLLTSPSSACSSLSHYQPSSAPSSNLILGATPPFLGTPVDKTERYLTAITPNRGTLGGGTRVKITGGGFNVNFFTGGNYIYIGSASTTWTQCDVIEGIFLHLQ